MATSRGTGARTRPVLLVGTRKGAFVLTGDPARRRWQLSAPHFLGHIVNHAVLDPRDRRTLLVAARAGHLGPTVFGSTDRGKRWREARRPPAFPKAREGEPGLVVQHVFWLAPGHAREPGVWYAGTSPPGLFRSAAGGETWDGVLGFNANPLRAPWVGDPQAAPPDGATLHSINIDPRDPQHLYIGVSCGGVFETTDGGARWRALNQGCAADFLPQPNPEYGHDVHCLRIAPAAPDVLYQQNHCGIYRIARPADRWTRIGENMPRSVGDIGFPLAVHPREPQTAWVFPMDGGTVWPRVSPGGKPAVYGTRNGGRTWRRLAQGLPPRDAWLTVKRQALSADARDPVGLYFGTTSGEVWASVDEGERWRRIAEHLPHIYSVEAADL